MGLIPLPSEKGGKQKKVSQSIIAKIKAKLNLKEIARDEKIIGDTCYKMIHYINKEGELSLDELKSLLKGLERSIISIQKKKKKVVEKKNKR